MDTILQLYTARELILCACCVVAIVCWCMEAHAAEKREDAHREECRRLREERFVAVHAARNEGWYEGVEYQRNLMTPKRDKAGRFA